MQVCRALLQPVNMQDTVVKVSCNGGAGPLLYHEGPCPTRAEQAGISWNQLELAGLCRVQALYFQNCSLSSVDFPLGQLLGSHISPLGQLWGSLIYTLGQLLVSLIFQLVQLFDSHVFPLGQLLDSHIFSFMEICHW